MSFLPLATFYMITFSMCFYAVSPISLLNRQLNTRERPAAMPSDLERAMESMITVFHKYAAKEGSGNTLSRRELKDLMENELSGFLKSQKDPATVDKIMKDLDSNGDGEVNFEEFVSLVVGLSIACEQCYQMHKKKMGK
uniref:Protein S100 n=2 Tax=Oncorhynchus mykiss TaxID=8022 RepID=A0A8C7U0X4_ONCMY